MTTNKIGNFIIVEGETVEPFLLATSFNSKLKTDKNLIRSLQKANYRGKVFVDMLMKVGNASQRFYSSFFNGNNFEMNNTRVIENEYELLDILLKIERKIICQDKQILNNSILTEYDKMEFFSQRGVLEISCQSDKIISRIDNGTTNRF